MMIYSGQLGDALDLARAFPDTQIILNHTGSPADRGDEAIAAWRAGMSALAGAANVAVKISDLGAYDHNWTTESTRPFIPSHHRRLRHGALHVRKRFSGGRAARRRRCDLRLVQDHRRRPHARTSSARSSTTTRCASIGWAETIQSCSSLAQSHLDSRAMRRASILERYPITRSHIPQQAK